MSPDEIRAILDRGMVAAGAHATRLEKVATLSARDTLYLYDMVYGNVKVLARAPRGQMLRQVRVSRLIAHWAPRPRHGGLDG